MRDGFVSCLMCRGTGTYPTKPGVVCGECLGCGDVPGIPARTLNCVEANGDGTLTLFWEDADGEYKIRIAQASVTRLMYGAIDTLQLKRSNR